MMTRVAATKLTPIPPAFVEIRKTDFSVYAGRRQSWESLRRMGSVVKRELALLNKSRLEKRAMSSVRSDVCVRPSRRRYWGGN